VDNGYDLYGVSSNDYVFGATGVDSYLKYTVADAVDWGASYASLLEVCGNTDD
jgi:hypothetical protein